MCFALFWRCVLFFVMNVICMLCLIAVPLPPNKAPFAVKIIIIEYDPLSGKLCVVWQYHYSLRNYIQYMPPVLFVSHSSFLQHKSLHCKKNQLLFQGFLFTKLLLPIS
jgi:hypothetical protein